MLEISAVGSRTFVTRDPREASGAFFIRDDFIRLLYVVFMSPFLSFHFSLVEKGPFSTAAPLRAIVYGRRADET